MASLLQLHRSRRYRQRRFATGLSVALHQNARELLTQGFRDLFGTDPNLSQAQALQAQAFHESTYGRGWGHGLSTGGQGSNNWGAIQGGRQSGNCSPDTPPPICAPGQGFLHGDSIPQPDGSSRHFECCYRIYPTPLAGATDLVKKMFIDRPSVLEAASRGDLGGFSAAMYDTQYYGGFGPTREDRIYWHMTSMRKKLETIADALDEPIVLSNEPLEAEFAGRRARRASGGAGVVLLTAGAAFLALGGL